jgi:mono/diheme cytochrome c family protein
MGIGWAAGLALVVLFESGSAASVQAQAQTEGNPAPTQANQSAPGDPAQGQKYFEQAGCGWCHAEAGRVAGKGPKLEGSERTDSFITFRIKHGKEGAMPAFGGTFNDKQVGDILAYIRSLKG